MMIPMIKFRLAIIPVCMSLLLWCQQAAATSVLPVSLQRMATTAVVIFHGRVTSNEVKLDPVSGRVATFTTFEVIELIKGNAGSTYTIKQIGGQLPGSKVRQVIHGVPEFSLGDEHVVFLPKASSLGFASPIGLSQGKFDIRELNGETIVSNGRPLAALPRNTQAAGSQNTPAAIQLSQPPASIAIPDQPARARLADFMQTVRGMIKE